MVMISGLQSALRKLQRLRRLVKASLPKRENDGEMIV